MRKPLLRYFIRLLVCIGLLVNCGRALAQTPTFDALTQGVTANPIPVGLTQAAILGFKVTVSGGSMTFTKYTFSCNQASNSFFANGTLYRSTTNSGNFNNGAGTPVGNVTFNGNTVTIDGLSETVTNTTYYYFLVADNVYNAVGGYCQFVFSWGNTFATEASGTTYPCHFSNSPGYNVNPNPSTPAPYAIKVANASKGLNDPATTLLATSTNVAMFGFSLATSTGTKNINQIQINSNLSAVSDYFSGIKIYTTSGTDTYSEGTRQEVPGTITTSGGYIKFVPSTPISASTTAQYYWLVANVSVTGSLPVNPQFKFVTQQTSTAFTATPSGSYNDFTAFGKTYAIAGAAVTVTPTSNLASGTITPSQTDMALFGFGISCSSNITVSGFNINSSNTADAYFGNGKLYTCPTSTYSAGSRTLVPGAVVTFVGNYAQVTGLSLAINSSTQYYYLVADNTNPALSSTITFKFQNGQSNSAIIQSAPTPSSYNNYDLAGNTLTLPSPTIAVNGFNDPATNGITSGSLVFGQTDIVLFGFSAKASGQAFNIKNFRIKTSGNEQFYFTNARLYRSTTAVFPGGSPLYTTVSIGGGGYFEATVNENIPNGTTYYYWLVADYNSTNYGAPTTFTCSFAPNQGQRAIETNPYSTAYNYYDVTGHSFDIVASENWKGGTVGFTDDFSKSTNFLALNGSGGVVPTGTTIVNLDSYTTAPTVKASTTIGGLTFIGANTTLTINSGQTLTINSAISVVNNKTATISGPGTLILTGAATLNVGSSSTLNFTNGLTVVDNGIITNNGTITTGAGSTFNSTATGKLTNTSIINAAGAITVASESGNSGTINLTGAGSIAFSATTGTFTNSGTIAGTGSGDITISSSLTNSAAGSITQSSSGNIFIGSNLSTVTNSGSMLQTGSGALTINATGAIKNNSNSTITFGSGTSTVAGAVTNNGTINEGSGSVTFAKFINNTTGTVDAGSSTATFTDVFNNKGAYTSGAGAATYNAAFTNSATGTYTSGSGATTFNAGFTNSGSFTPTTGTATFNGNYTNNGTFNYSAGTIIFNHGATGTQSVKDSSADGTTFNIVKFTGASVSKTIKLSGTGKFAVASTGLLTLTNATTTLNADTTGILTLKSDTLGSASLDVIPSGSKLIGRVKVERFIKGDSDLNYRGYRLLSSPVSDDLQTGYSLAYLKGSGSYLTGSGGADNGFDTSGGASLYLYRQDGATTPFSAITNIKNADLYQITTADGTTTLPVGNGFFYYYRGNNSVKSTALPSNVVLTATGHLNQGSVSVKSWFYPINAASFLDASSLSYTSTSSVKGFNLVGNPYASSIDWNKAFDGSNGIDVTNISPIIYIYNPYLKTYATYNGQTSESKDGGSNIIPSGQGFFVLATNSGAKLTFNESAKVGSQPATLLLNSAANTRSIKTLRLKLVKDVAQQEETLLTFDNSFNNNYVSGEDAPYLKGFGNVSFASRSADKHLLAINHLPFPKSSESVPMSVMVTQTGNYQLNFSQQENVPSVYDIWLKDTYLKDSLDIRHNDAYKFVVSADTNSKGANRFSLVIRLNPNKVVHLLNFNATKSTNEVKINWTAENEAGYTTYVLERSTDGGKTFKTLDSLTSVGLGTYNDLDPSPLLGDNYYRLKQTDVTGNISYSNVIKVMYANTATNTILANSNISVYPNPASSTLNLAITNTNNGNASAPAYKITITNSSGLLVKTAVSASASWQGQIDSLLPGTYFINVINTRDNRLTGTSTFIKL